MLTRGYIYVGIGGGITGDIQINHTDIHRPLKANYRREEKELMIRKLIDYRTKIPVPRRNEIMNMLVDSWQDLDIDIPARYKNLWLTNKLDGSEDGLVSDSIYRLVGPELLAYRQQLLAKWIAEIPKRTPEKSNAPKRSERAQITKKR